MDSTLKGWYEEMENGYEKENSKQENPFMMNTID
jgi:hypothetical protein